MSFHPLGSLRRQSDLPLRLRPLAEAELPALHEHDADIALLPIPAHGRYQIGFAISPRSLQAAQRLRFEVFNLEMNEGLNASYATGLDRDAFDDQMAHLVVYDTETRSIIGTYRLQSGAQAEAGIGFYSAQQYDLAALLPYRRSLLEAGRACIAPDHRSYATLILLWTGIRAYARLTGTRWMFGCCSITTADPDDGWRALKTIRAKDGLHPELWSVPLAPFNCGLPSRELAEDLGPALKLPKLFRTYMRLGAKVVSEPGIDREFGTVDFLIMLDTLDITFSKLEFTA